MFPRDLANWPRRQAPAAGGLLIGWLVTTTGGATIAASAGSDQAPGCTAMVEVAIGSLSAMVRLRVADGFGTHPTTRRRRGW